MRPLRILSDPFALALLLLPLLLAPLPRPAGAQSLIGPAPPDGRPLDRRQLPPQPRIEQGLLQIAAEVTDGAAATTVVQTLKNLTDRQQEAWWLLPLPDGAVADRFAMTVDGVETQGEVLDAQRARKIYEDIVRRRRDPGLLEYVGCGLLRARVFPIPPRGEVRVEVRYTQLIDELGGVRSWTFPLRSAWTGDAGPRGVGLAVTVASAAAIKSIWSPVAGLDVTRDGDHRARAGLELRPGERPARDLSLHWGVADQDFGAHVLTFRRPGEDGYFLALLAPKRQWPEQRGLVRSINLVLDTSGSMRGDKIQQARDAVRTFLQSLAPDDWFNVIPFSTDARPFFAQPVKATRDNVEAALQRTAALAAGGGTNIADALQTAMRRATPDCYKNAAGQEVVPITVFLTDGLPTVETTDIDELLALCAEANTNKARVFAFGVGDDVNTRLLDTLALRTRGDRGYVRPGEDIEIVTSSLFARLQGPVMTDVELAFDDLQVSGLEPRDLPDLFVEGQVAVLGRYHGHGNRALRLRGRVGRDRHEYVFEADFAEQSVANDWLPALWAQRRIAALLDAIRVQGPQRELIDEVSRIGRQHGIVTPYTSHLIVEEGQRIAAERGVRLGFGADPRDGATASAEADRLRAEWSRVGALAPATGGPAGAAGSTTPVADPGKLLPAAAAEAQRAQEFYRSEAETGARAVDQSVATRRLADAELYDGRSATALLSQRIGGRVLHLVGGVWVEQGYTAARRERTRRIEAFSDEYFALLRARPELAPVLAFSTCVVLLDGDGAIEITSAQ